jgi:hypothetical protein
MISQAAVDDPAELVAVTATRSVEPTSALAATYVCAVAPGRSLQLPPLAPQRRHWNAYVMGCVPLQLPVVALSDRPACGVPELSGGSVYTGGVGTVAARRRR